MTEPIRVLHFADAHIGMENYGRTDSTTGLNSRLLDFVHRMDDICTYAKDTGVDLVIFAGDAFKSRAPSPTHQREFAYRIRDLAALAPVVLLEGNHDLPQMDRKASSIEIYDTLGVPNVYLANTYSHQVIETQRGPVFVATAPYPIRQRLGMNDGTQGKTIAELDLQLANQLNITLETLAEEAEKHDMPRLLTGHFTISGAIFGSERQIMLGRDVEAQRSVVADARWDYVAMGHIHRHQTVSADLPGAPPVVYSGSIERIDFGEERDTKGFCSVQLVRGATTWEFVPLTQCRPFASLKLDLRESADPTADVIREIEARNLKEAVVRVLVDLTPETEGRFSEDKIREALRRAGTWVIASISRHVERPARVRLGSSSEALSDIELLERYLINREVPPARRAALLELADPILNATTDDTGE